VKTMKKIIGNKNASAEGAAILTVSIIVFIVFVVLACTTVIPAGHVGVVDVLGNVEDTELQPGFHFKNPLAGIHKMSTQTQAYTMSFVPDEGEKQGNDVISALTKEGLTVDIDITVWYKLTPAYADEMYKTIGEDYVGVIVRPQVRTIIREVVAGYEAKQLYSEERQQVAIDISEALSPVLNDRGIILERVLLRHIQLPSQLTKAIEAKLTAEQNIEKRKFEVQVEEQEKQRKIIEAEGIASANEIIAESLSTEYLTWYWIENLDSHESVLYVPVGDGGVPLFKELK